MAKYGSGFGAMGGMNIQQMMAQAQKKLQEDLEELNEITAEGKSGGGAVKVVLNGNKKLVNVNIDKEVVDIENLDILEDLIVSAYNLAFEQVQKLVKEKKPQLAQLGLI